MGKLFFWWGTDMTDMLHVLHTHMHDWVELEKQIKEKIKLTQTGKTKLIMLPQLQPAITFLSEIKILHSTHL
jgi:hypothetical protein